MGVLDFSDVAYSYGPGPFVEDLSQFGGERFIGLIGPNGSGKSTILKLAAGILKPARGTVNLGGQSIHRYPGKDRAKRISYLPQTIDRQVPFRVRELVRMGLYPYDLPPGLSEEEAMGMVGLGDKADCYLNELSGGEQRRVFIAMTLLQGAGVLLLDEPLANLDVGYQLELVRLLKDLRRDKAMTIVMALHDINLAFQFDEILVLQEGRVVARGEPAPTLTRGLLRDVFDVDVHVISQPNGSVAVGYNL